MEQTTVSPITKVTKTDIYMVPFSKMVLAPNVRTELGDIEELAASIKEQGVRVPMKGYKEKSEGEEVFVVVAGQRRFRAMELLSEQGIEIKAPFVVKAMNEEEITFELFLSNDGKQLTPLEQAEGFKKLVNYGYTVTQIADKLGKNENGRRWIQQLVKLADAPEKFKKLVRKGRISGSLAVQLMGKGEAVVQETIEKAERGELVQETTAADGSEIREAKPAKERITKKDLNVANSMKDLKEWMKWADPHALPESKAHVVKFLWRVFNNEVNYDGIDRYFKKEFKPKERDED